MQAQKTPQQSFECLGSAAEHAVEIAAAFHCNGGLKSLSPSESEMLCGKLDVYATGRGKTLVSCDDPSPPVIVLLSGKVRTVEFDRLRGCESEHTYLPGAVLGSVAQRKGQLLQANVISTEPVDFLVLTTETLDRLAADTPALAIKFLQALADGSSTENAAQSETYTDTRVPTHAQSRQGSEAAQELCVSYH